MKIKRIEISNFLGVKDVGIDTSTPVTIIAGNNGAGKSGIRDAIQMALTGEPSRVKLKKDYKELIASKSDSGFSEVSCTDDAFSIVLPSGKGNHSELTNLPYVLEAQRFPSLNEKDRRSYLLGLFGVKMDSASVCDELEALGFDGAKIEKVKPMLRAGFSSAQTWAADHAKELKGSWKLVTGGETWGADKGAKWEPKEPESSLEDATKNVGNFQKRVDELEIELRAKVESLGAANQKNKDSEISDKERAELEKLASSIERVKKRIEHDTDRLNKFEVDVNKLRSELSKKSNPDPLLTSFKNAAVDVLSIIDTTIGVASDMNTHDWDEYDDLIIRIRKCVADYDELCAPVELDSKLSVSKLSDYEESLRMMRNSVRNGHRDLSLAEDAKKKLDSIDEQGSSENIDVDGIALEITELEKKIKYWRDDKQKNQSIVDAHSNRAEAIDQAREIHSDIMGWLDIADALSPTGIPGKIVGDAIKPINERLLSSAAASWMFRAHINSDMSIKATKESGETISYELLSESEQWRVNAQIAEAISFVSGIKLLLLDRIDVLDLKGRSSLIKWIRALSKDGEIDTCIMFGTLKEPPIKLPQGIAMHWIQGGELVPKEQWPGMFPSWSLEATGGQKAA